MSDAPELLEAVFTPFAGPGFPPGKRVVVFKYDGDRYYVIQSPAELQDRLLLPWMVRLLSPLERLAWEAE